MPLKSLISMIVSSDSGSDLGSDLDIPGSLSDSMAVPADAPVGLSDPKFAARKRCMLDAVNRLRAAGADLELDIPIIAVVGSQSAGKSSLIESISGITLPRALGTCTRCPTECSLSRSPEPWRCVVSLKFVTDPDGRELPQPIKVEFGLPITTKSRVTERIRRAQCAILNRGQNRDFLKVPLKELESEERGLSFSSSSICLDIRGFDVEDLSFIDLPGLIVGAEDHDRCLVQQLAEQYISKESCIILVTITCETDFENQIAHRLAAQFDPKGARTFGVLTKPDRIPTGDEKVWINKIRSSDKGQGIEYFCVKNPDSQDLRSGITYEQAREAESHFFSTNSPWSNLERLFQRRLGTESLVRRLGQVLPELISKRLPELQGEVDKLLNQTNNDICRLPNPPSSEPMGEIMNLISAFVRSVEQLVAAAGGAPDENGLIQSIRESGGQFKKAIRQTAPDFRPLERPLDFTSTPIPPPMTFLSNEEEEGDSFSDPSQALFVEDVMHTGNSARTRELPNKFPYIVLKTYIDTFVKQWDAPTHNYFDFVKKQLDIRVKELVAEHFNHYTHGRLKQDVMSVVDDHLQGCAQAAERHVEALLLNEHEPFTTNDHYYREYQSSFLAYYKDTRLKVKNNFFATLDERRNQDMARAVNDVVSGLSRMGFQGIKPESIGKLLPADPMEPAIEIMADVRAYFQLAYKRFVDNIPMGVDRMMLRGITTGLQDTLIKGLNLSGSDGYQRCMMLLSEPEHIAEHRTVLQNRRHRLVMARKELVEAFI